jgi:hypothetical protein
MNYDTILSDGQPQLPDDLRNEAEAALKRVGAYLETRGDPAIMNSLKTPPSITTLAGISVVLFLVAYIIAEISNYYEIRRNWSHYRCMPSISPFAKFYGHDLKETMNFCIAQSVKEHAPGVITPIYEGINAVTGVVEGVFDKVESVAGGIEGLLAGFKSFVVNFVNSFRLVGTRIRMSLIRVKEIFSRVYGIFIAFAYAAISAITFGENLICNPLVTFVAGFAGVDICCFAPETLIQMADGSQKPIRDIQIGDRLAGDSEVTTTFLFRGYDTAMVSVHGVHVSGNHYLLAPNSTWIRADKHPAAVPALSIPRLWCLSTTTNTIPVAGVGGHTLEFTDFEESSDPEVVAVAQRTAEEGLNGRGSAGPTVADYSLGIDPTYGVHMLHGHWVQASQLRVGDSLAGGGNVVGIVREQCEELCKSPCGHYVSAAQLVMWEGRWQRAAHTWPRVAGEQILVQVLLDSSRPFTIGGEGEMYSVRDYTEWEESSMQPLYEAALAKVDVTVTAMQG